MCLPGKRMRTVLNGNVAAIIRDLIDCPETWEYHRSL